MILQIAAVANNAEQKNFLSSSPSISPRIIYLVTMHSEETIKYFLWKLNIFKISMRCCSGGGVCAGAADVPVAAPGRVRAAGGGLLPGAGAQPHEALPRLHVRRDPRRVLQVELSSRYGSTILTSEKEQYFSTTGTSTFNTSSI